MFGFLNHVYLMDAKIYIILYNILNLLSQIAVKLCIILSRYMYHLHTLRHMSYVYLYIFLTRQGNTSTIEAMFLYSGCGRVVQGAGHKAKRLVLQCINDVSSNPVEERTKICQLKDLILTLFDLIFRRIYINIRLKIN